MLHLSASRMQINQQQDRPRQQNQEAGVPVTEILDAYDARMFDGMPYRLLLPVKVEAGKSIL
ncbi:MAG: hypothetical protein R3C56_29855 [Pirellulaceae bacterium]